MDGVRKNRGGSVGRETQAEMFEAVTSHLPDDLFPGGAKANWWAKTVQLDLEKKGLVRRSVEAKPLRWYRSKSCD